MKLEFSTRFFGVFLVTSAHYEVAQDRVLTPRLNLYVGDIRKQGGPRWVLSWISDRLPAMRAYMPRKELQ